MILRSMKEQHKDHGEIILYQAPDGLTSLDVRIEKETIWLTQKQMAEIFDCSADNVSLHLKNIYAERELIEAATTEEFSVVKIEGKRKINRKINFYNLDAIISVGYRVNTWRGTQFRIWANNVLKEYLLRGYAVNQRFNRIENKLMEHDRQFDMIIKTSLPPREGIFYDGQVFDAHVFVSELIRSAKQSIVLIDNYIDETVLMLLSKRNAGVEAVIYTAADTSRLKLDLKRYHVQYPPVEIIKFAKSHDRFLILDSKTVFHLGASLKDLGKKWFAFSNIKLDANEMMNKLQEETVEK